METSYDGNRCIDQKLKNAVKKLFKLNLKAPSENVLHHLFKRLTDIPENTEDWSINFRQENLVRWLVDVFGISNESKPLRPNVKTFSLNLSIFCFKDEKTFQRLNMENAVENIVLSAKNHDKLLYVDLIDALLEHLPGLNYVIESNCWADVLQVTSQNQNDGKLYAATKGYNAITKLIERAAILDAEFCKLAINILTFPIVNILQYLPERITVYSSVKEIVLESLYCHLIFNAEILERLLKHSNFFALKLFSSSRLKTACEKLSLISRNEKFSIEVNKITVILLFYQLVEMCDGVEVADHEVLLRGILTLVRREIEKGQIRASCKLCGHAQKCWTFVCNRLPKYLQNNRLIDMEFQLLTYQLTPLFSIIRRINPSATRIYFMEEDLKICYMSNAMRRLSTLTIYLGFNLLDMMLNFPLFETEHVALDSILEAKEYYSSSALGMCFEMLMYCLNEIVDYILGSGRSEVPSKEQKFIKHLLECISSFVETFDLSWRDSVTAVDVVSLITEFLSYELWNEEITVTGLKLLKFALQKNMSPNLALLIDTTKNSSLIDIGPLIYSSCLDNNWEIREAALDVFLTVTTKANSKYHKHFPCLGSIFSEKDLLNWVSTMALDDTHLSVRIVALTCLQQISGVEGISEEIFDSHFLEKLYEIVLNEPEAMIRNESVILLSKIYSYQDNPEDDLLKMYNMMEHVVCTDKDGRVQSSAIKFWEITIEKHLTKQGMIDGVFPEVTFSKEFKKILTITTCEIKKRLVDVLNQLSYIGCLAIFLHVLQSKQTSHGVFTTAVHIVEDFHSLLKTHQITPELIEESLTTTSTTTDSFGSSSVQQTDQLIDEIFNEIESEIDILSNIDNADDSKCILALIENEKLPSMNTKRFVTPYEFMDFIYNTLPSLIDSRRHEDSDFQLFTDDEDKNDTYNDY